MAEKPTYEELVRRIQELEKAEHELSLAEDRLKKIFDNTQDAIFIHDLEGKILDVNDKMCRMYGLTKEEALEVTIENVSSPDMPLKELPEKWQKVINGEKILFEWEARRPKDDSIFNVEVSIQKISFHDKDIVLGNVRDITQRKKNEEEIEKSRRILLTVLNSIDAIVYIADMENHEVLFINEYCRRVSGDIVGRKCWKAIQGRKDGPCQFCTNDKLLTEEGKPTGVYQWEFQNLHNGRWYDCRDTAIEWPDGRIVRLEIATDITKRKQVEETLIHSKNLLRYIVEHTRSSVAVHDRDLNYIYVSQRYLYEFNVKEKDVIGKHHYEVFPDLPQKWRDIHQKALRGEVLSNEDDPYYHEDGTVEWTRWECRPWYEKDGSIGGIIIYTEIITEQKKAREKILLNEKRLQTLLDLNRMKDAGKSELTHFAMEAAVMLTGSSIGYIVFPNKDETVLNLFAWSREAMRECAIKDKSVNYKLCDTGLWGEAIRQRRPVITNDYSAFDPYKKGTPEGHVQIVRHMNVPIFDGDRIVMVVGVGNKPTEYCDDDIRQLTLLMSGLWSILCQKKSEQERKKLQDQLLQAQKMESVGILAGGVAHDFNNLLHVMRGNLELLIINKSPGPRNTDRLQAVSKSIDRASQLVQKLLYFSRKAKSRKIQVDVNQEIHDVIQILKRTISKMITLDLNLEPDTWTIYGDPVQIEQILLNLTNNAVDAMPEGGKLTIETANIDMDEDSGNSHPDFAAGHYVLLTVSDTGYGMDEKTLEHIYDPFFTTKEVGKGTGLGLSSVYGIVKAHDGYIFCTSETGKGTTFSIYLPVAEQGKETIIDQQSETEPQGGNETILVVDDEPEIRELTREGLEDYGYTVLSVDSGEKALQTYQDHAGNIDLVMLDLNMPGMGGCKCLQGLIGINPTVKVIIASGYTANGHGKDALSSGARNFIGKPYQLKELAVIIRKTLDAD